MAGPPDLPDQWATLWYLVRRVAGSMDRAGDALFRAELGVSLAQFLVLSVVDAHPGTLNQQGVADRLGLTKGTISRQVDAAVVAGLLRIETAAHSRRDNVVSLTSEGVAVVRRGDEVFHRSRDALLAGIDDHDLAVTVRTLSTVSARLDRPAGG